MMRSIGLGLLAAASIWGCSSSANDNPGGAGTGAFNNGVVGTATGGASAAPTGTGGMPAGMAGGTVNTGTSGHTATGGTPANTGTAGMIASTAGMTGFAGTTSTAGTTGGSAGMAGTTGEAGSAGTASNSNFKPPCITAGKDLVTIGDSWVNYTQQLNPNLTMRARADGALGANDSYVDHALAGTSLATSALPLPLIPTQWDDAHAENPNVKFVVMDGGGNDVLLGANQCLAAGAQNDSGCQDVVKTATAAGAMMQMKMKAAGVRMGIYFFYPHVPVGGHDILDYSLPMAKATCESMNNDTYKCIFVDTRDAFDSDHDGTADRQLIDTDDIHPTAAGEKVLADLIWKTMKDNCMAQPASSGCCTP